MKFTVERDALQHELSHLVRVTEKKSTIPILSTVLIESEKDAIRLATTDLDVGLVTICTATVSESGAIVLPAKRLFDIVKALPDGEIVFHRGGGKKGDDTQTSITSGGSEFKLATQDKEHFPAIAKSPKETTALPAAVVHSLVERTIYAITMEESRYALNGALFERDESTLRMVATDGHRLSIAESEMNGSDRHRVIIPKKALAELLNLTAARIKEIKAGSDSKAKEEAEREGILFARDDNHLFFNLGHRLLSSRMLAGQFPAYDQVIPKNNGNSVGLSTKQFSEAITRIALMADEKSHGVKLELKKGKLIITAQSTDVGEGKEVLAVDYNNDPVEIGFNAVYCRDFLNTISAERITFALNDGQSPALFSPEGDEGYRYIVMPMRLL